LWRNGIYRRHAASGPKRTRRAHSRLSAIEGKADIAPRRKRKCRRNYEAGNYAAKGRPLKGGKHFQNVRVSFEKLRPAARESAAGRARDRKVRLLRLGVRSVWLRPLDAGGVPRLRRAHAGTRGRPDLVRVYSRVM